jgi:hypothetical protein
MISAAQAAVVKGLLARGDKQSDIGAYFGENIGRVAEINTGQRHAEVVAAPAEALPLAIEIVPYGFIMTEARNAIRIAMIGLQSALARIDGIEQRLQQAADDERAAKHRRKGKR